MMTNRLRCYIAGKLFELAIWVMPDDAIQLIDLDDWEDDDE